MSDFIVRHGVGWRYRRRVPRDLQDAFPTHWLIKWLGSMTKDLAKIEARKVAAEHDAHFAMLRTLTMEERAIVSAPPLAVQPRYYGGEPAGVDFERIARIKRGETPAPGIASLVPVWVRHNAPRSTEAMDRTVRRFIEVVGNIPVKEITRHHVGAFRDALQADPGLSRASAAKYLDWLHALFGAAVSALVLDTNPCAGIRMPKAGGKFSEESHKAGFSAEQAKLILTAAVAMGDDFAWMARLSAYTGARSGELAQLRCEDVTVIDGIPVLRIHDRHGPLKNRFSIRDIPIPPACLGIIEYTASRSGPWLFHYTAAHSGERRGRRFQAIASRFLRRALPGKDKSLSWHSFRHAWRTLAREIDMPETVSKAIMGHALGAGEHGAYGSGPSLKVRAEWIARINPLA